MRQVQIREGLLGASGDSRLGKPGSMSTAVACRYQRPLASLLNSSTTSAYEEAAEQATGVRGVRESQRPQFTT